MELAQLLLKCHQICRKNRKYAYGDPIVHWKRGLDKFVNGRVRNIYTISVQKAANVVAKAINHWEARQVCVQKVWTNPVHRHQREHDSAVGESLLLY